MICSYRLRKTGNQFRTGHVFVCTERFRGSREEDGLALQHIGKVRRGEHSSGEIELFQYGLVGLPLFTSEQGWEGDIRGWAGERFKELHLEGSFRLAYNASMFVREGLGYQLSFRNLVDVSENSGLTFRPLFPTLEAKLYLIWNRYQAFTPIAERFLAQVRSSF